MATKNLGRHVPSGLEGFPTKSLCAIENDDEIMTAAMTCRQPSSTSNDRTYPGRATPLILGPREELAGNHRRDPLMLGCREKAYSGTNCGCACQGRVWRRQALVALTRTMGVGESSRHALRRWDSNGIIHIYYCLRLSC